MADCFGWSCKIVKNLSIASSRIEKVLCESLSWTRLCECSRIYSQEESRPGRTAHSRSEKPEFGVTIVPRSLVTVLGTAGRVSNIEGKECMWSLRVDRCSEQRRVADL